MTDTVGAGFTSPTVARRWLGREMRNRRVAAGVTEKEAADGLRSTVSKVSYTESGKHSFKPRDMTEVLLPLYGVSEDEWVPLLEACRRSRDRGWWQAYDDEIVPDWLSRYIGLEQGAVTLRSWDTLYPHGLVQTPDYARSLIGHDLARFGDDEIDARVEVRIERQGALTRDVHPPQAHFILDEAILHRMVGGNEVMAGQLQHLGAMSERRNVTVQVVPFAQGPHPDASASFTIIGFGDDDPGAVYVEGRAAADYLERPPEVQDHEVVFDQLADLALPPDGSVELIYTTAREYQR